MPRTLRPSKKRALRPNFTDRAVHTLPSNQQRTGILFGALGAVIVRVTLTFAAAQLLTFPAVQLIGGLLLIWIAVKLLTQ
ncbi:MAG TPA: hypothetical protein VFY96_00765, partial [Candidatus Binatia bacterium]|nr:hypothetical protein [Candidatus Binatia bacterium]